MSPNSVSSYVVFLREDLGIFCYTLVPKILEIKIKRMLELWSSSLHISVFRWLEKLQINSFRTYGNYMYHPLNLKFHEMTDRTVYEQEVNIDTKIILILCRDK